MRQELPGNGKLCLRVFFTRALARPETNIVQWLTYLRRLACEWHLLSPGDCWGAGHVNADAAGDLHRWLGDARLRINDGAHGRRVAYQRLGQHRRRPAEPADRLRAGG